MTSLTRSKFRSACRFVVSPMRALTTLVEQRRNLIGDKTRITNRLCSTLKEYFPQALDWFEDRDTALFCDFLQRWPSLKHVKRARQATLRSFFCEHNLRRSELIEERICAIGCASALTDDVRSFVRIKRSCKHSSQK